MKFATRIPIFMYLTDYTGVNKHSEDKRIGLMDSTVPIEAMLGIPQD